MPSKRFHSGELRLQEQADVREKIDQQSMRMVRDAMPDQHRKFFEGLEYLFLATVDDCDQPWVSLLTGSPGFVSSPDPKILLIKTGEQNDSGALSVLNVGDSIGVLGIDLSNRRRNRMHGRVSNISKGSISVTVVQSYGNCPKYISLREVSERGLPVEKETTINRDALDATARKLISAADTFFIASAMKDGSGEPYEGLDISHRGGQPGFVVVDSSSQITIPDYKGNNFFNTFGNLVVNPEVALLFINFETGDQVQIQGTAVLVEDAVSVARFAEAQRLLSIRIRSVSHKSGALDLRWRLLEGSPFSPAASANLSNAED